MALRKISVGHAEFRPPPAENVARLMALHAREEHEYPASDDTRKALREIRLDQIQHFAEALGFEALDIIAQRNLAEPRAAADLPPAMVFARNSGRLTEAHEERLYEAFGPNRWIWMIGRVDAEGLIPAWTTRGFILELDGPPPASQDARARKVANALAAIYPHEFDVIVATDWADKSCAPWNRPWFMLAVVPAGYQLPDNTHTENLELSDAD